MLAAASGEVALAGGGFPVTTGAGGGEGCLELLCCVLGAAAAAAVATVVDEVMPELVDVTTMGFLSIVVFVVVGIIGEVVGLVKPFVDFPFNNSPCIFSYDGGGDDSSGLAAAAVVGDDEAVFAAAAAAALSALVMTVFGLLFNPKLPEQL